jgi:hypothetical protein
LDGNSIASNRSLIIWFFYLSASERILRSSPAGRVELLPITAPDALGCRRIPINHRAELGQDEPAVNVLIENCLIKHANYHRRAEFMPRESTIEI